MRNSNFWDKRENKTIRRDDIAKLIDNNPLWDRCENGTIRNDVAEFIDNNPLLSKYVGDNYYQLEDSIVDFLSREAEKIYRERDREYQREDVLNKISEYVGQNGEIVANAIPFAVIDRIARLWGENLEDRDGYWECVWDTLDDTIIDELDLFGDELNEDDAWIYAAYLDDWFKTHDAHSESPAPIDEFFECEMQDDELSTYYTELADKYKDTHLKKNL